jgi:O-antigen ligase
MLLPITWALATGMTLTTWFNPFSAPSLYDGARFLELAILAWISLVFLVFGDLRQAVVVINVSLPPRIRLAFGGLAILAAASVLHSRFPLSALLEVSLILLLLHFGTACVIAAKQNKPGTDRIFISSLLAGALIFSFFFILTYQAALNAERPFNWLSPFVTFSNIRFFSQFQAYTLPLMLMPLLAFALPRTLRATIFAIAAIWWALHFASGSRSVWVALSISTLVIMIGLRHKALPWLVRQGQLFLTGGMIYLILAWWTGDFGGNGTYGTDILRRGLADNGRLELWEAAWTMIRSSPWLGVGPMHFGFYNFKEAAHPHNSWLQIAAEYGLPLALLLSCLLFWFLGKALRWCHVPQTAGDRNINICLTTSLLCGLTDGMFSGNTIMPQSQLLLVFVSGWLIGRNLPTEEFPACPATKNNLGIIGWLRQTRPQALLIMVVVAALSLQLWEATGYYTFRKGHAFDWSIRHHPRYWQDGHRPAQAPDLLPTSASLGN